MVQRFKNPNRQTTRPQTPYIPEYRRHGVSPVPIDEQGRVDEEAMESAPRRGGPPLVGAHDATYQVDGMESEEEDDDQDKQPAHIPPVVPPMQNRPAPKKKKHTSQIAPGEYLILINGQVVASGSEEEIKQAITSMIYNESADPQDMVLLRRMEIDFGITIR